MDATQILGSILHKQRAMLERAAILLHWAALNSENGRLLGEDWCQDYAEFTKDLKKP